MKVRTLGKTGWKISAIGFGAWGIGGQWGAVPEADALAQAALQYVLAHPAVSVAIPGAKDAAQAEANAGAADGALLPEELARAQKVMS